MSVVNQFIALLNAKGSPVRYRRNSAEARLCPCRTPEGFRDPRFHLELQRYSATLTVEPGAINPGVVADYALAAADASGTEAFPLIPMDGVFGQVAPWRAHITGITFPKRGNVDHYNVYRGDNGGTRAYVGSILRTDASFIDNLAVGGAALIDPVICNEAGLIPVSPIDLQVKAFVQPIQSTRATRLNNEILTQLFGEVQADDHLGIFPCSWKNAALNFRDWSQSGDEFIEYDGQRFLVVNSNKIPDPSDGNPNHHWEVGLRLITQVVISD